MRAVNSNGPGRGAPGPLARGGISLAQRRGKRPMRCEDAATSRRAGRRAHVRACSAASRRSLRLSSDVWISVRTRISSGMPAMMTKPALVITLSLVSPHKPSPPSWPSEASATGADQGERAVTREQRGPQHAPEDTLERSHGRRHRLRPRQGHGGRAAAARRLVPARAPGPDDAVRPQRRRQDDAAADALGRDLGRRRRAELRQGRPDRAARPAPAARPRPQPARLRAVRRQGPARARDAAGRARARDGRGRAPTPPRSTPTRAPRRGSSTPAATTGASGSTPRCTASASATSTWTAAWRPSAAAS